MDQRRHARDDERHEHRKRVDEDPELDVESRGAGVVVQRRGQLAVRGRVVEEHEQRPDRRHEGGEDRARRDPTRAAARELAKPETAHQAAREREGDHEPPVGGRAHPRRLRMSSTLSGRRRRYIATIRPSPTTTSQAATTITTSAKTCASWSPFARPKASSARLPALSISSRHSRMTSGLRRISTPAAPVAKSSAERTRYQVMSI